MNLHSLTFSILAASSLTLSAASMAQTSPTAPAPTAPEQPAPRTPAPMAPAPMAPAPMQGSPGMNGSAHQLDSSDRSFLEDAAQAGHTEIEGSKLAQSKAKSADVKTFADQMIQDHTKVGEELTALASQKGYTPPTEPSLIQKTKLKALSIMDDTFDKRYANQIGVSAHEDVVKLFSKAASEAKDPDVKAFAAKNLPTLQQHLEMARALQQKVSATQ